MSGVSHRGISYSIKPIGARRWKWEIDPPWSVKGLSPESGEVEGQAPDAAAAARSAIDSQTKNYIAGS